MNIVGRASDLEPVMVGDCRIDLMRQALLQATPSSGSGEGPAAPRAEGSLPKAHIAQVVRADLDNVKACYVERLEERPELEGTVTVKFTISEDGRVREVLVNRTTVSDRTLDLCVGRRACTWVFDPPKGNGVVVVTYPFHFASK